MFFVQPSLSQDVSVTVANEGLYWNLVILVVTVTDVTGRGHPTPSMSHVILMVTRFWTRIFWGKCHICEKKTLRIFVSFFPCSCSLYFIFPSYIKTKLRFFFQSHKNIKNTMFFFIVLSLYSANLFFPQVSNKNPCQKKGFLQGGPKNQVLSRVTI